MQISLPSGIILISLIFYIFLINIIALSFMWWDKQKARKEDWRVSEVSLLVLAFIGGAVGLFFGMFKFRHKTKKRSFQAVSIIGFFFSLLLFAFIISLSLHF